MEIVPDEVVNFDSKTKASNWINGSAVNWYKELPNLDKFDKVVSDNLIEILHQVILLIIIQIKKIENENERLHQ